MIKPLVLNMITLILILTLTANSLLCSSLLQGNPGQASASASASPSRIASFGFFFGGREGGVGVEGVGV